MSAREARRRGRTGCARRLGAVMTALVLGGCSAAGDDASGPVIVGSKVFTEGVILGEVLTGTLAASGVPVRHRRQIGGTRVLWSALTAGEIDLYVEYTGTIVEEILGGRVPAGDEAAIEAALRGRGVILGPSLGFENTYAVGMRDERAAALGIAALSDLAAHPSLRLGFSSEFMERTDGWPALRQAYGLPHTDVRGLDHDLAYRALAEGSIDATDLYTTDAEIAYYGLRALTDDRGHFPQYRAVVLYRADLPRRSPAALHAVASLAGTIGVDAMITMNAAVKLDRRTESAVAAELLRERGGRPVGIAMPSRLERIARRTAEHLALVGISLLAAVALAVPLGVASARRPRFGAVVLGGAGVVQTIPALALLVMLVPLLGIGGPPAIAALFLYSVLPVLRNTAVGLQTIPRSLLESADALGLPPGARLRLVELPLATPALLAGVKTAAVINVGTATLGALVGAGGYGQPILTGIRLDDTALILEGAVPAAALALFAEALFAALERRLVPRGLRPGRPQRP